jgi:hypothetical protein
MNSDPRWYLRAQIVPSGRMVPNKGFGAAQSVTPNKGRIRERSARPSASQEGIRKTPDVALLPNLAVYENQGGAYPVMERTGTQSLPLATEELSKVGNCAALLKNLPFLGTIYAKANSTFRQDRYRVN